MNVPMQIPVLVIALAKAIEGPFDPNGILSDEQRTELREIRWRRLGNQARGSRITQARSVLVMLGVGPNGESHTGAAAALGWVKALAAARGAVDNIEPYYRHRHEGAVAVLRAIYGSAEQHGLTFSQPACLSQDDPRQGILDTV